MNAAKLLTALTAAIAVNAFGVQLILQAYPNGLSEIGAQILCLWVFTYPAQAYYLIRKLKVRM